MNERVVPASLKSNLANVVNLVRHRVVVHARSGTQSVARSPVNAQASRLTEGTWQKRHAAPPPRPPLMETISFYDYDDDEDGDGILFIFFRLIFVLNQCLGSCLPVAAAAAALHCK